MQQASHCKYQQIKWLGATAQLGRKYYSAMNTPGFQKSDSLIDVIDKVIDNICLIN